MRMLSSKSRFVDQSNLTEKNYLEMNGLVVLGWDNIVYCVKSRI